MMGVVVWGWGYPSGSHGGKGLQGGFLGVFVECFSGVVEVFVGGGVDDYDGVTPG